jgi:hypothetical protein
MSRCVFGYKNSREKQQWRRLLLNPRAFERACVRGEAPPDRQMKVNLSVSAVFM